LHHAPAPALVVVEVVKCREEARDDRHEPPGDNDLHADVGSLRATRGPSERDIAFLGAARRKADLLPRATRGPSERDIAFLGAARRKAHAFTGSPRSKRSCAKYFASRSSAVRACASMPSRREM